MTNLSEIDTIKKLAEDMLVPIHVGDSGVVHVYICTRNIDLATKWWLTYPMANDHVFVDTDTSFEVYDVIEQKLVTLDFDSVWAHVDARIDTEGLTDKQQHHFTNIRWWEATKIRTSDFADIRSELKEMQIIAIAESLLHFYYKTDIFNMSEQEKRDNYLNIRYSLMRFEEHPFEWVLRKFYNIDITSDDKEGLIIKLKDMWSKKIEEFGCTDYSLDELETIDDIVAYWPDNIPAMICHLPRLENN